MTIKVSAVAAAALAARTLPRGGMPGAAPALTAANVPPIAANPAAGDLITMTGSTRRVPD